jgi:hypothetical protein
MSVYPANIVSLLQTEDLNAFETLYTTLALKWSKPFDEYFNANLRQELLDHSVRWVLEAADVYDPYSGITKNIVEGMHSVIKRLNEWKEVTIDAAVLSFNYLQVYYVHELLRGFCGTGNYSLKQRHMNAFIDPSEVDIPKEVCDPDSIVSRVKGQIW